MNSKEDSLQPRPLVLGITGGIASGKSTVAALFADLGAAVVSADQLAREAVAPGSPALQELVASGEIAALAKPYQP